MLWTPLTLAHFLQGAAVATATQVVEVSDHSTENTLITAVAGIVGIIAANVTVDLFKRRRGHTDDAVRAKARRLARENVALKRKLAAAEKRNEHKEATDA